MHILVISDIHANIVALEAVLADAAKVDATWCLGDLVGYGPNPNECVSRIRNLPNIVCLIGNHDAASIDLIDTFTFNDEARQAIFWTQQNLTHTNKDYLKTLPSTKEIGAFTLVHGSPRHPVWEYLLDTYTATINFRHFDSSFCLVGHSHIPVIYQLLDGSTSADLHIPQPNQITHLTPRSILNPGSVGQPRDRDPRAAYAILDPDELTWEIHRVPYDIKEVQARMKQANMPDRHILRLESGW
ncbi:MAG: metallophosphoesterase family protein [Anaerolineales bacterium]|nr:metallophosphoesterase family protein [Anaerolineales bacterium]